MRQRTLFTSLLLAVMAVFVIGCGQASKVDVAEYDAMRSKLEEKEKEVTELKSEVEQKQSTLVSLENEVTKKDETIKQYESQQATSSQAGTTPAMTMLPLNANSGECYARLYYAPVYKTVVDTVLKSEASERVEVTPATYTWVEEKILVKEESKQLKEIPAEYKWVEEKVLVSEAHKEWKKGRGLVERVDEATGEIMCLVEVPASYKIVKKRVQSKPASVETVIIPAVYETNKVRKMATPPKETRIAIPAEYQTVTRKVKVQDSRMEWKQVLCETNMNRDMTMKIQHALLAKGHNPGPIDGIIGPLTHKAIKSYQEANNLATGGLTHETLKNLDVKL